MEIICLDTNVLIAHKRAKKADKNQTFLFRLTTQGFKNLAGLFIQSNLLICAYTSH
jgi:hypothetical protein